jgi:hypothetical protein
MLSIWTVGGTLLWKAQNRLKWSIRDVFVSRPTFSKKKKRESQLECLLSGGVQMIFALTAKGCFPPIPTMIQVPEVAYCVVQEQLKFPPAAACAVLPE